MTIIPLYKTVLLFIFLFPLININTNTKYCKQIVIFPLKGATFSISIPYRAYKICDEQLRIMNSPILLNLLFGTCFRNDLLINFKNQFTPKLPNNPSNDDVITDPPINTPTIWIHLSFIGKRGSSLINHSTKKINRLHKQPAKFVTLWNTTNANAFLSTKDPKTKQHQSSVVHKFTCPAATFHVGKTDRCLFTCLKEHSDSKDSEIRRHINSCGHFYKL
jgi:hypothetical protein